ncbi:unnamed protein product [Spirodela intermedia]|uniref:Uncharacterized protein n=1 Tax=Spirodela intermedia TaxID=51605 RepID=A0A7I8JG67_SPIIN|nr:unnamed protein product [Spirodela intermedia]CAA6669144.1 unnamed protein product [Spirodela intermedia]
MARGRCCYCSPGSLAVFLILSAVPLALLSVEYRSLGWVRECAKWDDEGRRFLVSTFLDGGVSEVVLPNSAAAPDPAVAGNGSVGITLDRPRGRLLVAYADLRGGRYGALGAYDLSSRQRLFLTQLSGGDGPSLADDVAVDGDGNAFVTDAKGSRIWKVGPGGELLSTIRSPLFTPSKTWLANIVGLNGIVFHPNGYLLVVHTFGGRLFRVDPTTEEVNVVEVSGSSLLLGDGLALLSPTKLVVAGTPSGRIFESSDDWRTAALTGSYYGSLHRIASSVTVKDGKVFLNHLLGGGLGRRTHVITEAIFSP